jgi:nicotinamidase-related amidase
VHDPFYDLFPQPAEPVWEASKVALLTIDVQYLDAHEDGWLGRVARKQGQEELMRPRFEAVKRILPKIRMLQDAFRASGEEVMHIRIAYRTKDGRDAGPAHMPAADVQPVPRDNRDDDLLPEVAAKGDEIVFSKTSAGVFNSTDIDRVLRAMEIKYLVLTGIVTEGCVELAAMDAADRGYHVMVVSDATSSSTPEAHDDAIERMTDGGFIVAKTADQVKDLVELLKQKSAASAVH